MTSFFNLTSLNNVYGLYYEKKVWTVMVNNSTNINKTNKHLFLNVMYCEHKTITMYEWYKEGHGLGQAHKCGGVYLRFQLQSMTIKKDF